MKKQRNKTSKDSENKKEKIKVYLQYPWKASECAYYTYLLTDPPKEIKYITSNTSMIKDHVKK